MSRSMRFKSVLAEIGSALRELWKSHPYWLVSLLMCAVAFVFYGGQLQVPYVNIVAAVLTAGLVRISERLNQLYQLGRTRLRFREFFGFTDTGTKVAIVLASYSIAKTEVRRHAMKLWGVTEDAVESFKVGEDHTATQEDISAASALISTFGALGFQAPSVIWDTEAVESLNNSDEEYTTYIAIGLYSSKLVRFLNTVQGIGIQPYFQIGVELPPAGQKIERLRHAWRLWVANYTKDKTIITGHANFAAWTGYQYRSNVSQSLDRDYGLITRVQLTRGRNIFVIGAMDGTGTYELGKYLRDRWKDIYEWRDPTTNLQVGRYPFAIVLDVPIQHDRQDTHRSMETIGRVTHEVRVPDPQPVRQVSS